MVKRRTPKGGRGSNQHRIKGVSSQRRRDGVGGSGSASRSSLDEAAAATLTKDAPQQAGGSDGLADEARMAAAMKRRTESPEESYDYMVSALSTLDASSDLDSEEALEAGAALRAEAHVWYGDSLEIRGVVPNEMEVRQVEGTWHLVGSPNSSGFIPSLSFSESSGIELINLSQRRLDAEWNPVPDEELWDGPLIDSVEKRDNGTYIAGWSKDGRRALLISEENVMTASRDSTTGTGRGLMKRDVWDRTPEFRDLYYKEFSRR